jgi:2-hydroxychromene-2-carboxylate isomerase
VPERLTRSVIPSTVIRLSTIDRPARIGAAVRRATGRRGRVELFFAFDDACSAAAVVDLVPRLAGREVDVVALPVVARGIPGDPAVRAKREYAIADARRLGRRSGLDLARDEPIDPGETAFLAEWVAAAEPGPAVTEFCAVALRRMWFGGGATQDELTVLWREHVGGEPRREPGAVRRNERLMARRGPYDTPAAVVHGQWFFAHDRLAQIADRLDDLGWRAA